MLNFNTLLFVSVAAVVMAVTVFDAMPFFNSFIDTMDFMPRKY